MKSYESGETKNTPHENKVDGNLFVKMRDCCGNATLLLGVGVDLDGKL